VGVVVETGATVLVVAVVGGAVTVVAVVVAVVVVVAGPAAATVVVVVGVAAACGVPCTGVDWGPGTIWVRTTTRSVTTGLSTMRSRTTIRSMGVPEVIE
jgi:hypothetical protein